MKAITIILFSILTLSCERDAPVEIKEDPKGKWVVIAREEIETGVKLSFPHDDNNSIFIEFNNDTISLSACGRKLGSCKYSVENGKLSAGPLLFIEPCAIDDWIPIVSSSISYSVNYTFVQDRLKIISSPVGEYHIFLSRVPD
jgi:hypothetical protein